MKKLCEQITLLLVIGINFNPDSTMFLCRDIEKFPRYDYHGIQYHGFMICDQIWENRPYCHN